MARRSRDKVKTQDMTQYYFVIGFFVFVMAGSGFYTLLNPQQSFSEMPVVDEEAILVHNGQSHGFTQASNKFFTVSRFSVNKRNSNFLTYRIGPCLKLKNCSSKAFLTRPIFNLADLLPMKKWKFQIGTISVKLIPNAPKPDTSQDKTAPHHMLLAHLVQLKIVFVEKAENLLHFQLMKYLIAIEPQMAVKVVMLTKCSPGEKEKVLLPKNVMNHKMVNVQKTT